MGGFQLSYGLNCALSSGFRTDFKTALPRGDTRKRPQKVCGLFRVRFGFESG
jgi:hypothetical protein